MKRAAAFWCLLSLVAACTAPTDSPEKYRAMSTVVLWSEQRTSHDVSDLAFIEAELALRGETSFGTTYLGKRTAEAFGKRKYSRDVGVSIDKNCDDFSSSAKAQAYFLKNGGPHHDPAGLDRDGDGLACEWGRKLFQFHKAQQEAARKVYSAPRRSYQSRCYTGPRGGTSTITASGNRNYSGC